MKKGIFQQTGSWRFFLFIATKQSLQMAAVQHIQYATIDGFVAVTLKHCFSR